MGKMSLKAARTNVGMIQKDAAKALNVSNKTLSSWEKEHQHRRQTRLMKYVIYTNVLMMIFNFYQRIRLKRR